MNLRYNVIQKYFFNKIMFFFCPHQASDLLDEKIRNKFLIKIIFHIIVFSTTQTILALLQLKLDKLLDKDVGAQTQQLMFTKTIIRYIIIELFLKVLFFVYTYSLQLKTVNVNEIATTLLNEARNDTSFKNKFS